MSDDDVFIGMFRPTLGDVCKSFGFHDPDAIDRVGRSIRCRWESGAWDTPVYATRDEIIEKMAKLALENRQQDGAQ